MRNNSKFGLTFFAFALLTILLIGLVGALTASIGTARFIISGNPGDVVEKYILVKNVNDVPVNITLSTDASNFLILDNNFTLAVGEEKKAYFRATFLSVNQTTDIKIQFDAEGQGSVGLSSIVILIPKNLASSSVADVAYILKDSHSVKKSNLINPITDLGYTVDYIYNENIPSTNFSQYLFVLVGNERLTNYDKIDLANNKYLMLNSYYYYSSEWGISSSVGSTSSNDRIVKYKNHKIMDNTVNPSENFLPYTNLAGQNEHIFYLKGQRALGTEILAYVNGEQYTDTVIAVINQGGIYLNGKTANKRGAFLGIVDSDYWTEKSKTIYSNTVKWLIEGEDRDNDGFFTDTDCNDRNASIFPGADEIAYNNIDEDCNGFDLIDADNDEYCKAGSIIQNKNIQCSLETGSTGSDCSDEDNTINKGAEDKTKNCINDAPVLISDIPEIIWNEDENSSEIDLNFYFYDYEQDSLIYSVYQTSPDQNISVFIHNNLMHFSSADDWHGSDWIIIKASDGSKFTTSNNIILTVSSVNDEPVILNKNNLKIEVNEDFLTASFNLDGYKSDDESINDLVWGVENTNDKFNVELNNNTLTFTSVKDAYCTSNCGFTLFLIDTSGLDDSEFFNVKINPVNDAPVFVSNIENLTWNEDFSLKDEIDLNDYFSDVDSELVYSISGNTNIHVAINNSIVSFSSLGDWFGIENVKFKASDGEHNIESNEIRLEVREIGDISPLNCNSNILEDTEYNCTIETANFNNPIFDVQTETNADCYFNSNIFYYKGTKDYFGSAGCLIKACDANGCDEKTFNFNISNVNDAPVILSFNPDSDYVKILNGSSKIFTINAADVDNSDFFTRWFVDFTEAGAGESYNFNMGLGNYSLRTVVSDNEYSEVKSWNIDVLTENFFTCSELGGDLCTEDEICSGDIFNSNNAITEGVCCKTACIKAPPAFSKDIDVCEFKSENISIEIQNPDDNDEFFIGDEIDVELKIKNLLQDDSVDLDLEFYLFDATDKQVVDEDTDESISIDEDNSDTINSIKLTIPDDADESHEYAIYSKADDSDEICNENYVLIDVKRNQDDLVISKINTNSENFNCGDNIEFDFKVKNIGNSDQDAYIEVSNDALGIKTKTQTFEIEKFDDKDTSNQILSFDIPDNKEIIAGDYKLNINLVYGSEETSYEKTISIANCQIISQSVEQEDISNQRIQLGNNTGASSAGNKQILIIALVVGVLVLIIILVLFLFL